MLRLYHTKETKEKDMYLTLPVELGFPGLEIGGRTVGVATMEVVGVLEIGVVMLAVDGSVGVGILDGVGGGGVSTGVTVK